MTTNWNDIMSLPRYFKAQPASATTLQLEQVVQYFIGFFSLTFQSVAVVYTTPVVMSLSTDNSFHIIIEDRPWTYPNGGMQHKIPFSKFVSPWNDAVNAAMSGNREEHQINLLICFAMMSMHGKCDQIVSCFGLFIIQTLKSHQFTYQGEKIIGWSIQDGHVISNHPSIYPVQTVAIAHALIDARINGLKALGQTSPGLTTSTLKERFEYINSCFIKNLPEQLHKFSNPSSFWDMMMHS